MLIKNSSGTVLARYIYDPWGNVEYKIPSTFSAAAKKSAEEIAEINPFRYRSYYYDTESNLYYLITRYYDPYDGVFISPDSFDYLDPNTIGGLNLYSYCNYNPINYVDPTGEFLIFLFAAVVGFTVSFASSAISQAVFNGGQINWGVAAIDGLFGAISAALWMIPGLGALATGFINAGLTAANGLITTGIENDWQYDLGDIISIAASSILSGIVSGKARSDFFNNGGQKALKQTHKFANTVGKRIVAGYYNNGVDIISKSLKSASKQMVKSVVNINLGKGFIKDWLITGLQAIYSITFSKGLSSFKW